MWNVFQLRRVWYCSYSMYALLDKVLREFVINTFRLFVESFSNEIHCSPHGILHFKEWKCKIASTTFHDRSVSSL